MSYAAPSELDWGAYKGMDLEGVPEPPITKVTAQDGCRLAVATYGPPSGRPVFLLPGSPHSCYGPVPSGLELYFANMRVITYGRPGSGESGVRDEAIVAKSASDILSIADKLDTDQFSVVGRSGGGPHALAGAALLSPKRLKRAVVLAGATLPAHILFPDDLKLRFDGMVDGNIRVFEDIEKGRVHIRQVADAMSSDPANLFGEWWHQIKPADKKLLYNPTFVKRLLRGYQEAVRQGCAGWEYDIKALYNHWGFDVGKIDASGRLLLWHGSEDPFVLARHARMMADMIPGAQRVIASGASHFSAYRTFLGMASWAADGIDRRRSTFFKDIRFLPPSTVRAIPEDISSSELSLPIPERNILIGCARRQRYTVGGLFRDTGKALHTLYASEVGDHLASPGPTRWTSAYKSSSRQAKCNASIMNCGPAMAREAAPWPRSPVALGAVALARRNLADLRT